MTGDAVPSPDRRLWLLGRDPRFNGVDFAAIRPGRHARIDVHFINRVRVKGTLARDRLPVTLAASGVAPDPVVGRVDEDADWSTDTSGRPVLRVTADIPDVPARYLLTVHSEALDPYFRSAVITVPGQNDVADCGAQPVPGQLPGAPGVPIDYLAKDFASFCQALSDFSAASYPLWTERSEADFGVMLMEVLSALADELSYLQDRVAAEATLGTATQRLSLVRHARLVDYEPAPAIAASTIVQFDVAPPPEPGGHPDLPDVIQCQAISVDTGTVDFAAGWPSTAAGTRPALDARWNRYADPAGRTPQLAPYLWDPDRTLLRQGATSMWIAGHGHGFYPGQELLIDTAGALAGEPPVREIVRLTEAEESVDPAQARQEAQPVTLIRWSDGLASDHDLTRTQVAGNLVPAMQGQVTDEVFAIPGDIPPPTATGGRLGMLVPLAAVRADHSGSPAHCLYTLAGPLAWQSAPAADGGPAQARPALTVYELAAGDLGSEQAAWQWAPRLLDADATARAFTVTPERYSPAAPADGLVFTDYDGDGATIRFGDGTFGRPPVPGTTFRARYLAGGGDAGNVPADTITGVAPGDLANSPIWRCTNPFPATGGAAAETHAQIQDRVPQQVGSSLLSLTEPADYQQAALSFFPAPRTGSGGAAWARQAIAAARWTGSWLSTLTIADPAADEPRDSQLAGLASLVQLLSVRRLAGADTAVAIARYRWLDLRVACAASPGHHPGDVAAAVLARLSPWPDADGETGFFGRDKWAFGQPLEASALIAAIQSCPGVAGVTRVHYRWTPEPGEWRPLRATVAVGPREILRIDNDRDRPGHGLLFVTAEVAR
ncbi:MAG TPA: hypothetical protein VKG80_00050 [Trebonia sp.]|nr:hypothetical protein [Trebonia sp.]